MLHEIIQFNPSNQDSIVPAFGLFRDDEEFCEYQIHEISKDGGCQHLERFNSLPQALAILGVMMAAYTVDDWLING